MRDMIILSELDKETLNNILQIKDYRIDRIRRRIDFMPYMTSQWTRGYQGHTGPEGLFNFGDYFPIEVNDDWFEIQLEPIPITIGNRRNTTPDGN